MPSNGDQEITFFGRTNARQPYWEFGIRRPDRLSHMYVIGKTGTGKSTLLETMLRQDIARGEGCALIDPHGDLVDRVYQFTHGIGRQDIVYLDFADPVTLAKAFRDVFVYDGSYSPFRRRHHGPLPG